jgi:hypothetical protein
VVRAAVDGSPHARVFIETPNLEWILDGQVIWDLCYEHCSLFSPGALARALTEAGFAVERIDHVFGGQYLFAEARPDTLSQARRGEPADSRQAKPAGSRPAELSAERSGNSSGTRGADIGQISPADIGGTHSANRPGTHPPCPVAAGKAEAPVSVATGAPSELLAAARRFANAETDIRRLWCERLAAEPGRLVLWGAGAKGVTLANLADPDAVLLAGVVDINPNKIGRFLPGTGHPILAPRELTARGIRHAVLMNPNYRREIAATLAETAPTIDLLEEP